MVLALILVAVVIAVGVVMVDLPHVEQVCSGTVVSTELCEPARLGRSVFGAVLAGSGVIALAIVLGAWRLAAGKSDRGA